MAGFLESKHLTRIGVLDDGLPANTELVHDAVSKLSSKVKVVKTVTVPPDTVDASVALTQLKSANPEGVIVAISSGLGPVWEGLQTMNWSPVVLTSEIAYFSGYSAAASLGGNAFSTCIAGLPAGTKLPASVLATLVKVEDTSPAPNEPDSLLATVDGMDQLYILRAAINKYHSTAPQAIAAGVESIGKKSFFYPKYTYSFSKTSHAGGTSTGICKLTPLGQYSIPIKVYP